MQDANFSQYWDAISNTFNVFDVFTNDVIAPQAGGIGELITFVIMGAIIVVIIIWLLRVLRGFGGK